MSQEQLPCADKSHVVASDDAVLSGRWKIMAAPCGRNIPLPEPAAAFGQFSLTWWRQLRRSLKPVDSERCSYLHGHIKPEHFLRTQHGVCVVDWEATARGPAVCDRADASFHLIRDLVYVGASLREIPVHTLARLRVPGAVTAWRLLRWLDRRRPGDLALLPGHELRLLLDLPEPAEAARSLAVLVAAMRSVGVPR